MSIRKCRACRVPKWATDPCSNADCSTQQRVAPLRSVTPPVTAAVKHGFHAGVSTTRLLSDYDLPLSARSKWQRVAS